MITLAFKKTAKLLTHFLQATWCSSSPMISSIQHHTKLVWTLLNASHLRIFTNQTSTLSWKMGTARRSTMVHTLPTCLCAAIPSELRLSVFTMSIDWRCLIVCEMRHSPPNNRSCEICYVWIQTVSVVSVGLLGSFSVHTMKVVHSQTNTSRWIHINSCAEQLVLTLFLPNFVHLHLDHPFLKAAKIMQKMLSSKFNMEQPRVSLFWTDWWCCDLWRGRKVTKPGPIARIHVMS